MPRIDWSSFGPGVPGTVGISAADLEAAHDTDAEREGFVPSRLSTTSLKATYAHLAADGVTLVINGQPVGGSGSGGLTAEQVRDLIGSTLVAGTNVTITPNDASDIVTISASGSGGTTDPEVVRDTIAAALVAGSNVSITHYDTGNTITLAVVDASTTVKGVVELATAAETTTGTDATRAVTPAGVKAATDALATVARTGAYGDLTDRPTIPAAYTDEQVRDVVGATLVAGSGVVITPDDAAERITIAATGTTTSAVSTVAASAAALRGRAPQKFGRVLSPGPAGAFDAALVESPCVWWDETEQKWGMLYVGYVQTDGASNGGMTVANTPSIGLAWSDDMLSWTKEGQVFARSGTTGTPDFGGVSGPVLVVENGVYHLFYIGLTSTGYEGGTPTLCLATAPSIRGPWTRSASNPILAPGGTGWRSQKVYHVNIVKRGATYYGFINATGSTSYERIGLITAPALTVPWTPDDANSPLLSGDAVWDLVIQGDPFVYQHPDGSWVMHYFGAAAGYLNSSDGIATTSDTAFPYGLVRDDRGPFLVPGPAGTFDSAHAGKPWIVIHGGQLYHFYTGDDGTRRGIGLAIDQGNFDEQALRPTVPAVLRGPNSGAVPTLWVNRKSATNAASSVVIGDNLQVSTGTNRAKTTIGNTSGNSELLVGQSASRCLLFNWTYNATAANATAALETYGGSNQLNIQNNAGPLLLGGSTGRLGFFGKAPVARPATPTDLAGVIAALQALGLVT